MKKHSYVGLDVHKESIAIAVTEEGRGKAGSCLSILTFILFCERKRDGNDRFELRLKINPICCVI